MDRLRHELRDVFDRRQTEFSDVAASRQRVMRAGMAARNATIDRRAQLLAGVAAVAIAALLVGTFVYIRSGVTRHASPVAPPTSIGKPSAMPTAPQPAGYVIYDADIADASHGWALLTNCIQPMTGKCHYYVTATADGGSTWSKPVQVGGDFDPTDGGAPRHVRFINAIDGFAYGGTASFVTHDGGLSWAPLRAGVSFDVRIDGEGNQAWVTAWPCAKGAPCSYVYVTSDDGGKTWSNPANLPSGFGLYDMRVFWTVGIAGLLLWSGPPGNLVLVEGGGTTVIQSPCSGNVLNSVAAAEVGGELWELCLDYPTPITSSVAQRSLHVSTDRGTKWKALPIASITAAQASNGFVQVAAAPPGVGTFVFASNQTSMTITHDGGRTWKGVGPNVGFQSIRFVTPMFGVAFDVTHGIWVTTDGGDHWTEWTVSLPQA